MTICSFRVLVVALAVVCFNFGAPEARAQSNWTYVSHVFDGGQPRDCTTPYFETVPTGPCLFYQTAFDAAADGGNVSCVDAGYFNFGAPTISKSVTLDCLANGGGIDGGSMVINAPGKTVRLRNITLSGFGQGPSPPAAVLEIIAAASVELENVVLSDSPQGIYDHRTGGKLSIRNSVIVGNSGSGIVIVPQSGSTINVVLDNVSVRDNLYGLAVGTGARVMVTHSVFSLNTTAGIEADSGGIIEINDALISNNTTGIIANAGASISLSNTTINSNNTGISGVTQSFGSNRLIRNAVSDGTPPTRFGATSSENGMR